MILSQEVRRLSSQWCNGVPMYPGLQLFTWVKVPCMPYILIKIEPFEAKK